MLSCRPNILYLVMQVSKGIVEAHGGSLEAHSDGKGLGSTFTVTLSSAFLQHTSMRRPSSNEKAAKGDMAGGDMESFFRLSEDTPVDGRMPPKPSDSCDTAGESALSLEQFPSFYAVCDVKGSSYPYRMKSILVVDDVRSNRIMLRRLLRDRCDVSDEAVDGKGALDKVRDSLANGMGFDLITMDYQMPIMDGNKSL